MSDAFKITGSTVSLGSTLALNYYVSVSDERILDTHSLEMRFTFHGEKTAVTEYTTVNGEYVFSFCGVAPQQLADLIDASLYLDGTEILTHNGYSIKQNLQNLLAMSATELGISAQKRDAMVTLISDLLVYGEAAQNYKDYATDTPVTEGIDGMLPSTITPTEADRMTLTGNTDPALHFNSATVHFDNANQIRIEILASVAEKNLVAIKINGKQHTLDALASLGNGVYRIATAKLYATQFADVLSIELSYDGTVCATIAYSVNAYAYAMTSGETESTEMQALALALYRYGQSAIAYNSVE